MIKISQSLMKAFQKVEKGEDCPLKFKAFYIDESHKRISTPAMELGHYFEYLGTGQLPREGNIPKPILLKTGPNAGKSNAAYQIAEAQAENLKKDIAALGFEIIETGVKLTHPMETDIEGTTDILANHKDYGVCIIDVKFSGLLNDKWNEYGWLELAYKVNHITQALHYTFLKRIPFFFAAYSSVNDWERKWFQIVIDPSAIHAHYLDIQTIRGMLSERMAKPNGFPASPSLSECIDCPVKCKFEAKSPTIEIVHYPQ